VNAETIAQSLGKFIPKSGGGFMACCPAHDDSNPSLSIDDAENGGVLVKCWAGCTQDAVVTALKNRDLWPDRERVSEQVTPAVKPKVVGRYNYPDADGNILYWKERLEPGRGGRAKEFRFRHIDPATKENAFGHGKHNPHVLYNLPNVLKAKSVIFTEGERLVDLLAEWGLVGTTLDTGSDSRLTPEQIEQLSRKRIAILRDADEPGLVYAQNLANDLNGKCESLKVILLPGLESKEDFREWRDRHGNDKSALLAIIKGASEWEFSTKTGETEPLFPLRSGRDLRAMDIKIEWLVDGVIPRGAVILLYGRGGIGKTTLMMMLADAIDRGETIFGMATVKTRVIIVDFENSLAVLSERAKRTAVEDVLFWDSGQNPPSLDKTDWVAYEELLKQYPGAVFVFDTLRSSHSGDENSSEVMTVIMQRMRQLRDAGATIILLHHTPKGNDRQFKGSGAIFDLCDQTLALYQTAKPGSDQEASDDDDDPEKVYRFGTGKKTRYRPHRVFLTFDTEQEVFTLAKDPADEALEQLYSIVSLVDAKTSAKQSEIVKAATGREGLQDSGRGAGEHASVRDRGMSEHEVASGPEVTERVPRLEKLISRSYPGRTITLSATRQGSEYYDGRRIYTVLVRISKLL
jgi:archaellum biogenesis ATPase FlaH